jgi:hypothetical protein
MGLMDSVRDPKVGGGLAAVCFLAAVGITVMNSGGGRGTVVVAAWFYDLNTKTLFEGPREGIMPIDAPSGALKDGPADLGGKAGVKAWVYSCGECTEKDQFIGYLQYHPQEMWGLVNTASREDMKKLSETKKVRTVDGPWMPVTSPEGKKLIAEAAISKCPNPKLCLPSIED